MVFGGIVMIVVAHNLAAMNSQRQFNITDKKKAKNVEKLSSGYKVNRAADDAAGLSISEKMRNQIRGLNQAMSNIEDGVAFCKVADGALNEVHSILGRIGELAVQAANDVNDDDDRIAIDNEVQQLKSEMRQIFHDTQFNGKHYWIAPYIPEVSGTPNDIQVYESDKDEHNGYGGIIVNGIRYTWDSLGVTFDEDGYFKTNNNGDGFKDYKDEIIQWNTSPSYIDADGRRVTEKDVPPNIRRLYEWRAETDGIYVNNVLAVTKDDLLNNPLGTTSEGTIYGFEYHGMNIEFTAPTDDAGDWKAISEGINGKADANFSIDATWEAFADVEENIRDGIVQKSGYQELTITNDWKDYVADRSDYYSIDLLANNDDLDGHADGFMLKDTGKLLADDSDDSDSRDKINHTSMKWEEFSDSSIAANSSVESNGGYPIIDWGINYDDDHKKDDNKVTDITLNGDATYTYKDSDTKFSMSFSMLDETSLESMENELNNINIKTLIYAPVATDVKSTADIMVNQNGIEKTPATLRAVTTEMSYALQRDSGKSFENLSEEFEKDYRVSGIDNGKFTIKYSIKNTRDEGNIMTDTGKNEIIGKCTLYKNQIMSCIKGSKLGEKNHLCITLKGGEYMDGATVIGVKNPLTNEEDESEKYSYKCVLDLEIETLYTPPNLKKIYDEKVNADQRANAAISSMMDRLYEEETPDVGVLRSDYSSYYLAKEIDSGNGILNTDGTYTVEYDETYHDSSLKEDIIVHRSHTLSASEYDQLKNWYDDAEVVYENKKKEYNDNVEAQFDKIYDLLRNANPQIRQTSTPVQRVWTSDPTTKGRTTSFDVKVYDHMRSMYIQSGANSGEHQEIKWKDLSLSTIGMSGARTLTRDSASQTITKVQKAVKIISAERSRFGAQQVRLERAYDNNANYSENLQNAESSIRDTDMAKEAMELAKHDILLQAGQSMMAQANQQNQGILQLIQSR